MEEELSGASLQLGHEYHPSPHSLGNRHHLEPPGRYLGVYNLAPGTKLECVAAYQGHCKDA